MFPHLEALNMMWWKDTIKYNIINGKIDRTTVQKNKVAGIKNLSSSPERGECVPHTEARCSSNDLT